MDGEKQSARTILREDLLRVAVQFLQNPKVRDSSTPHKEAFLKKKGLTDEEVRIAFERAGPSTDSPRIEPPPYVPNNQQMALMQPQPSLWTQWRYITRTILFASGLSVGLYYLFDRFIGPLLWGSHDRLRSMEVSIESLESSLADTCRELKESLEQVKTSLAQQQVELLRISESRSEFVAAASHVSKIEADIASVKGLLLSRRQFPTIPSSAPGIPAWQLSPDTEEVSRRKDSSNESGGDPSPVSNGTSSPELVERVDERGGSSE